MAEWTEHDFKKLHTVLTKLMTELTYLAVEEKSAVEKLRAMAKDDGIDRQELAHYAQEMANGLRVTQLAWFEALADLVQDKLPDLHQDLLKVIREFRDETNWAAKSPK